MTAFELDLIWKVYEAGLQTDDPAQAAAMLDLEFDEFDELMESEIPLQNAWEAAQNARKRKPGTLVNQFTESLTDEMREFWEVLKGDELEPKQKVLAAMSDTTRQRLLVHALAESNYNVAQCCQRLRVTKKQFNQWCTDPNFKELLDEIEFSKKNWIESQLMKKVAAGAEKSTIFVASTLLKDRGYGQSLEVSGTIQHVHGLVDLTALELDASTKIKLLEAVKASGLIDTDGLLINDDPVTVPALGVRALG